MKKAKQCMYLLMSKIFRLIINHTFIQAKSLRSFSIPFLPLISSYLSTKRRGLFIDITHSGGGEGFIHNYKL
ncbi:MAG: hypothetical protein AAF824_09160 [Bacteroidota bacterium]